MASRDENPLDWLEAELADTLDEDLELELEEDLPLAMLTTDAVRSILENLVENARKYAPVKFDADGKRVGDPLLIRTRRSDRRVLLEVLDRGPGISPKEAPRIFQAFYRIGNEATRTSRGTGLGLHLVALQAQAIGAKARVVARSGGGSIFEISLEAVADSDTRA